MRLSQLIAVLLMLGQPGMASEKLTAVEIDEDAAPDAALVGRSRELYQTMTGRKTGNLGDVRLRLTTTPLAPLFWIAGEKSAVISTNGLSGPGGHSGELAAERTAKLMASATAALLNLGPAEPGCPTGKPKNLRELDGQTTTITGKRLAEMQAEMQAEVPRKAKQEKPAQDPRRDEKAGQILSALQSAENQGADALEALVANAQTEVIENGRATVVDIQSFLRSWKRYHRSREILEISTTNTEEGLQIDFVEATNAGTETNSMTVREQADGMRITRIRLALPAPPPSEAGVFSWKSESLERAAEQLVSTLANPTPTWRLEAGKMEADPTTESLTFPLRRNHRKELGMAAIARNKATGRTCAIAIWEKDATGDETAQIEKLRRAATTRLAASATFRNSRPDTARNP